jgi:type I restriction enzyme R subunit
MGWHRRNHGGGGRPGPHAIQALQGWIAVRIGQPMIDGEDLFDWDRTEAIADRLVELARANHAKLLAA